jgi:hypothetical protein
MMVQTWQEEAKATSLRELRHKLPNVASQLQGWVRSTFGHVILELKRLKVELEKFQADPART